MFNQTSINKQVIFAIVRGIRAAQISDHGRAYVQNKKGNNYLRIDKVMHCNGKIGYKITDKTGKNIRPLINKFYMYDKSLTLAKNGGLRALWALLNATLFNHEIAK